MGGWAGNKQEHLGKTPRATHRPPSISVHEANQAEPYLFSLHGQTIAHHPIGPNKLLNTSSSI
eukprot:13240941-Alexandrium_andersonii.AAC.1